MGDKKFEVTAEVKVLLTQQDVDDIMVAALEGGITYWCDEAKVVGEYLGEYASEQISRGGTLILHDAEEGEEHLFTIEQFMQGFRLYLEQGCHVRRRLHRPIRHFRGGRVWITRTGGMSCFTVEGGKPDER